MRITMTSKQPCSKLTGYRKDFAMLVLTRAKNESVVIGDNIEVLVADVSGRRVRLGITAPRETSVHRKEVYEQIKAQDAAGTRAKYRITTLG